MSRTRIILSLRLFQLAHRRVLSVLLWLLLAVAGAGLGFLYYAAGDLYEYQDTVDGVHLPQVDAIVVLAGGRGRIAAAGDLWYRYWELAHTPFPGAGSSPLNEKPPVLYISGMGSQTSWGSLGRQFRRGIQSSMTREDVVMERESSNTEENARWLLRYANERGWRRILLVTSSYHMKRALMIFGRVFGRAGTPIRIETMSVFQDPFEADEWRWGLHGIRVSMFEYGKLLWYRNLWKP